MRQKYIGSVKYLIIQVYVYVYVYIYIEKERDIDILGLCMISQVLYIMRGANIELFFCRTRL